MKGSKVKQVKAKGAKLPSVSKKPEEDNVTADSMSNFINEPT